MSQYLDGIASYVREGGAFAMIGGDQSFSAGDYAGTPIEDVLPVTLLPSGPTAVDETPAKCGSPTRAAATPSPSSPASAAQNENPLDGAAQAARPEHHRAAQGRRPDAAPVPEGRPVLVVGEAGRGRVLALLSDSSWFWSFVASGGPAGPARVRDLLALRHPLAGARSGADPDARHPAERPSSSLAANLRRWTCRSAAATTGLRVERRSWS